MSERETSRPVLNYLRLIRDKQYPYYLIVKRFVDDVETYYKPKSPTRVVYTVNPRWLHRRLEGEIKHEKLTVKNISRILRAFLFSKKLEYYTTTTKNGCKSYHIELNPQIIEALKKPSQT